MIKRPLAFIKRPLGAIKLADAGLDQTATAGFCKKKLGPVADKLIARDNIEFAARSSKLMSGHLVASALIKRPLGLALIKRPLGLPLIQRSLGRLLLKTGVDKTAIGPGVDKTAIGPAIDTTVIGPAFAENRR